MRKALRRLAAVAACVALAVVLARFGPYLTARLFGNGDIVRISERFSEALREKSELVVYEVEVDGQETVSQEAWLLGTVQMVDMSYTFLVRYYVDLSRATVSAQEHTIHVQLPALSMGYAQLEVDETQVRTYDFLYSLTPQRYAEIKEEPRARLVAEYAADASCWQKARDAAVTSVERLLDSVAANASTAYQLIVEVETPANVLAEAI